jgi:tetratricopeptide (TPR) repeat protein
VAESRHAHPEALDLWQQVLSDAEPDSSTAANAHRGVAAALIRLGRMEEAHAALDTAVRIASEHGEWALVAESAAVLSRAGAWSWREHGVVHTPFIEVLTEAVPHVAPDLQARLLAILQLEYFYGWKSTVVEEYGRKAVELARTTGDVELLREVMMLRLVASAGSWDAAARLELAEELIALGPADELGVTALFHLGCTRWDCGDPDGADDAIRRSAEAAAELRHSGLEIPLGWWRATRARDLDDPDHDRLIDEVMETHRRNGYIASRELECLHSIRRGPVGAPVAEATVRLAEQCGMPVRALVAHAVLESGHPEDAHALLGEPAPDEVVDYSANAGRCLRLLVLSATGTPEEVRAALAPLEGHLGAPVSYGSIDHLGVVDHFVAAGYAALGDRDTALGHAREAVVLNERLGCRPWQRRSEALLARLT